MKRDGQGISEVGRIVPETIQKVTFWEEAREKKAGNLLGSPLWWSQSDWESRKKNNVAVGSEGSVGGFWEAMGVFRRL